MLRLVLRKCVMSVNVSDLGVVRFGENVMKVNGSIGMGGRRIVLEDEVRVDRNDSYGVGIVMLDVVLVWKGLVKVVG